MTNRTRALFALLLMSLMWGYGWASLKIGVQDAEPFTFAALRTGISAVSLLILLRLMGRPFWPTRIPELVCLALVQTAGLFTLSTSAIAAGSVGRVAFLVSTRPFYTLMFAWPLLGERVRGLQWLAIALAALGLMGLVQPWHLHGSLRGNLLALGAGVAWSVGAIMIKRIQQRAPMDLIALTAWQMVFGAIPMIGLAMVMPEAPINWTPRFIGVLLFTSVIITAIGWLLWTYALSHLEAGTASLATLLSPVIATISAHLHFGERPGGLELGGMACIALALAVLSVHGMRETRRSRAATRD